MNSNYDKQIEVLKSQSYNSDVDFFSHYEGDLKRSGQDLENYNRAFRNSRVFRKKVLNNRFGKQLKMKAF